MIEITKNFQVVSRFSNLRGIIRYASKYPVVKVSAIEFFDGGGSLCVIFANDAIVTTHFADFTVLLSWIKNRQGWPVCDSLPAIQK